MARRPAPTWAKRAPMRRRVLLAPLSVVAACSSGDTGTLQILVTNTDTLTGPPAVTSLSVLALDASGDPPATLATAKLPASTIDLGAQNETEVASIEVTGAGASGAELVSGLSLPVEFGALAGATLPVFVQRLGQFVPLPPGPPMGDSRRAPLVAEFEGQYLFVGGGSDASLASTSQLYDFAQFALLSQPPTLPVVPVSAAFVGTVALFIDASGSATYFDFSSNQSAAVPALAGGSFADVAGGATIISDLGSEFIVGATRTTASTQTVLEINPNDTSNSSYPSGNLTWLSLTRPRLGASAAWVSGVGLVVAGGSATASGVETLALSSTATSTSTGSTKGDVSVTGTALPYPPDPSVGAGATALSTSQVLLAGGITPTAEDAGARTIDLGCTSTCMPQVWEALPVPITSVQAFFLSPASALVVGNEPFGGATQAFVLTTTSATVVPQTVPHFNAAATVSPVGSIVLVGGANDIESFLPAVSTTP